MKVKNRRACRGAGGLIMAAAAALAASGCEATAATALRSTAGPPPPCTDRAARCLERVGRKYIDALLSHDGSALPLASDVRRTENALTNAQGAAEVRDSFAGTTMVKKARDIRFWANETKGEIVFFFCVDVYLDKQQAGATTTRAGKGEYQVAVSVPEGTYTVHEAERFKIARGYISEIEIIAHVEQGNDAGSGWPTGRNPPIVKP